MSPLPMLSLDNKRWSLTTAGGLELPAEGIPGVPHRLGPEPYQYQRAGHEQPRLACWKPVAV